jgi:hypothetical protein
MSAALSLPRGLQGLVQQGSLEFRRDDLFQQIVNQRFGRFIHFAVAPAP